MSKREFARYVAAKRRLASAQNKADRLTVKTAEGGMRDVVRPSLILNAAGVAFRNIPNGVINCVTVDRKLKFRFDHFDGVLYQVFSIDFFDNHQNVIRGYVGTFIVNVGDFIKFIATQDFS